MEVYQYMASEEPLMMPRPDERQARTAAKKSGLLKAPPQQAAFAAQNLEDMLIYDTDRSPLFPAVLWIRIRIQEGNNFHHKHRKMLINFIF